MSSVSLLYPTMGYFHINNQANLLVVISPSPYYKMVVINDDASVLLIALLYSPISVLPSTFSIYPQPSCLSPSPPLPLFYLYPPILLPSSIHSILHNLIFVLDCFHFYLVLNLRDD